MEEIVKQWKEEHKHGVVSMLWVSILHHQRQGYICEVWFAPNDKRNFRCKPPCAPYTVMRTYVCGTYKAILEATRSEIFNKGDALAICIDNGYAINYILDEKSKDLRIRKRLEIGPLAYWVPLAFIIGFVLVLLVLLTVTRQSHAEDEEDHWRITP